MNTIELTSKPDGKIEQRQAEFLRQSLQTLPIIGIRIDGQEIGDKTAHFDAIPETYRKISNALISQGGRAPSPELIQEILDTSALTEAKVAGIKQPYIFAKMIENANNHFAESQDLSPTRKNILTGFFSCVDRICRPSQEKINQATDDAISEGIVLGKTKDQVIQEVQSILDEPDPKKVPTSVKTKAQVLGIILRTFEHRVSRASISDKKLADWVEQTFQKEYDKVGGASAQVADFLNSIGEENCTVYTETNSPDQANAYKHPIKFLRLSKGLEVHQVADKESTNSSDPTKINYPIEIPQKTEIIFNGKLIKSKDIADRVILTTEYFDPSGEIINVYPLFKCSNVELEQIASRYEYFIVNGIQYLQRYSPETYQQIAPKIAEQLSI